MRTTDGLQTTITCRPVNVIDQRVSVELSLEMSLPMPHQDEHLPDQIEAHVLQPLVVGRYVGLDLVVDPCLILM